MLRLLCLAAAALAAAPSTAAILYSQDFENPDGFVNDGGDINIFRSVNQLYHDQPAGFVFSQTFTTETLLIGGTQAYGVGYTDPSGKAGKYVVSQLSDAQDDRLGLAFNVGGFKFLNFRMDISSIDLDRFGGPFVPPGGLAPVFRFRLFDNPGGAPGVGTGTPLDFVDVTGLLNPSKTSLLFSTAIGGLDASASTDGNVIFQIDLLSGGYAAFDNIVISAADVTAGLPEPESWALLIAGFGLTGAALRRRRSGLPVTAGR